ncbi:Mitochondrial translocator assembly and maintenance protein 41, partial [Tetrabaena socialis]
MAAPQSLLLHPRLAGIVKHFPPVTYAFAYGSGAFNQPGLYDASEPLHSPSGVPSVGSEAASDARQASGAGASTSAAAPGSGSTSSDSKPMMDFIFAVHDAHKWHEQVCGLAEAVGVGVHFNTLVQLDAQTSIKYGVVEASALQRDLTCWTHLYVAGRMHKPTAPLLPPPPALEEAAMANRHHALATALVLLPPTFTEEELLRTVVGLSYGGDVRLAVGAEDPHKVARIVNGSWDALYGMYIPLLKALCTIEQPLPSVSPALPQAQRYAALELEAVGETAGGRRGCTLWRQSKDPATQGMALRLLPPGLLHEMAARH